MKLLKLATLALVSSTLVIACDDQGVSDPADPGQSLRAPNFKVKVPKEIGTTFSNGGNWPDGVPVLPWPMPDILVDQVMRNSNAVFAAAWGAEEEPEWMCHEACAEAGGEWDGGVYADGEYGFGEIEFSESEDGSLLYQVDVEAHVAFGCTCAE